MRPSSILRNILILSLGLPLCGAEPAIPRLRPDPPPSRPNHIPDEQSPHQVPDQNSPESPASPGRWPPSGASPGGVGSSADGKAQARIQYKMGNMESRLETEKKSDVVREGVDKMKDVADLVSAVLEKGECQDSDAPSATNPCASASFTPTPTTTTLLPPQLFTPCSSYAKILSSCASATPSFYALPATAQASCACYASPLTSASTGPVCTGTAQAQVTGTPTLAPRNFDDKASACSSYFRAQGYTNLAAVLMDNPAIPTAVGGSQVVGGGGLGAGFCGNVDAGMRRSGSNGSRGLELVLGGVVWTDCKGLVSPELTKNVGAVLKAFGHVLLVGCVSFVALLLPLFAFA